MYCTGWPLPFVYFKQQLKIAKQQSVQGILKVWNLRNKQDFGMYCWDLCYIMARSNTENIIVRSSSVSPCTKRGCSYHSSRWSAAHMFFPVDRKNIVSHPVGWNHLGSKRNCVDIWGWTKTKNMTFVDQVADTEKCSPVDVSFFQLSMSLTVDKWWFEFVSHQKKDVTLALQLG